MTDPTQSAREPQCSIIIPTWRRTSLLKDNLAALDEQTYKKIEVIVVCDGHDPETRALSQSFRIEAPVHWLFHKENRGVSASRNSGVQEAAGEVILFLDDDVLADRQLVEAHMSHHLAAAPGHSIAVCAVTVEQRLTPLSSFCDQRMEQAWKRSIEEWAGHMSASGADSVSDEVQRLLSFGLNSSIRRNVFLASGGYDEVFRTSGEDNELGLRLHLAGVEFVFESRRLLAHRNSKFLPDYFRKCWRASGSLDPYRVLELDQRNAQTRKIVSRDHGYLFERMAARAACCFSRPLLMSSRLFGMAANRLHSKALFAIWARSAQTAEYWNGLKQSRYTHDQLRSAAGASRTALMLHSICAPQTPAESSYYVSPRRFHRFMQHFRESGFHTANSAQWMEKELPPKTVLLTFDDAYDDLYTELLPLVIDHGHTPLIFVVVDHIGGSNTWDQAQGLRARKLLTVSQIREMQRYGVEFGSHTLTHPHLTTLGHAGLVCELRDSKHRLEDLLGSGVTSFAYPYGTVDRRVRSYVAEAGYKLAFTTIAGPNWWNDPLCQNRTELNDFNSENDFASIIATGWTVRQNIGDRFRKLEQCLPGSMVRASVRGLGKAVRAVAGPEKSCIGKASSQQTPDD